MMLYDTKREKTEGPFTDSAIEKMRELGLFPGRYIESTVPKEIKRKKKPDSSGDSENKDS